MKEVGLSTKEKRSKAGLKYLLISISYHEGKEQQW